MDTYQLRKQIEEYAVSSVRHGGFAGLMGVALMISDYFRHGRLSVFSLALTGIGLTLVAIGLGLWYFPWQPKQKFAIDSKLPSNVIRAARGVEHPIHADSKIYVEFEGPNFWWKIDVSTETDDHGRSIGFDLTLPIEDSTRSWSELAGYTSEKHWAENLAFPIMPGIPSGYFEEMHYSVTDQLVCFGDMKDGAIEINCVLKARYSENVPPEAATLIYARAMLSLREVHVLLHRSQEPVPNTQEISRRLGVPHLEMIARDKYDIWYKCVY